ncbi:MAG: tRNA uridine-5-carboxymethylaminomethyl(34) synthesis GTPase MnmE [Candidatus Kapabacteria bacterium]|nr:tRNA uridine-5-carboxymethylaminomethyl(34) synthesis GTPase MnmE [Candidatus Kapabacteria bacterium]
MNDTIVALATPPGVSGLAVIRLSGRDSIEIAEKCFNPKGKLINAPSHTIHFGWIVHKDIRIDNVTASIFIEPRSYTGENSVEISCHGGMVIVDELINALIDCGARMAEPGEFTRRAFLNGKMDLMQVEAVADLIHSVTIPGAITAARQLHGEFTSRISNLRRKLLDICSLLELELDFSDEDLTFVKKDKIKDDVIDAISFCSSLAESYKAAEILRSGFFVGIAGFPNSGKSTLFNALLKKKRAIVSETPGTTRDYLEETIILNGMAVKLIDTAGLRETDNIIELEGIKLVQSILEQSNLVLVINDISISPEHSNELLTKLKKEYPKQEILLVQNKIDKINFKDIEKEDEIVYISAKTGEGIDYLEHILESAARKNIEGITDVLINQRHALLLKRIAEQLSLAVNSIDLGRENELISLDIRNAVNLLGELSGENWNEDVLNNIFSRFCIGK